MVENIWIRDVERIRIRDKHPDSATLFATMANARKKSDETKMCEPVGLLQLKVKFREVARGARDLEDGEVALRPQLQLLGRLPLLAAHGCCCRLHSLPVQPVLT